MSNTQKKNVPELRFPGFEGEWEEKQLGDLTDRVIRKNKNLESKKPLTISGQLGLMIKQNILVNQFRRKI
ncbi:Type I restriction-modification system,specificity subunit S [Staphylococcus aureus M1]|nr:Type I restriction-modification system,specificity subunit S [Staphylococcus aureus M1]